MNINEAIEKLLSLPQRVADEGVAIMREEVPRDKDGLYESIFSEVSGNTIFIGTEKEYAYYVQNGRGEVVPSWKKEGRPPSKPFSLHWENSRYGDVFAMRAGPTKPNDFVGRTAKRLARFKF